MSKQVKENDLRPVTEKEAELMSDNFSRFAMGLQILLNTAQRQAFHVLGLAALHEDKKFMANLSSLTSGISSRLLYSGVVTYPILQVRKFLEEKMRQNFRLILLPLRLIRRLAFRLS